MSAQQPPTQPSPGVDQGGAPPSKSGCGIGAVIMVALLMFVLGGLAGIAAVVGWLMYDPTATEQLGIAQETTVTKEVVTVAAEPPDEQADSGSKYALLYPIEESLRIDGPLDKEPITRAIKDRRYELRKCYQAGLERNDELKGEIGVQFTINGSTGKVVAAVERHTNFADDRVKKCLLDEIKGWKFPGKKDTITVVKFDVLMLPITGSSAEP